MRLTSYPVILAVAAMAAWPSCKSSRPVPEEPGTLSSWSPAHICQLAATDYDAAMRLAEEGMRKGRLSAFESYELRSKITYQYTEDYPEAADWLRKALERDEARDPSTRTELLYHLATILKSGRDFTACLAACSEGKEIAHGTGHTFAEHSFDFMAGNCLFSIGEDEVGFAMMKEAVAGASSVAVSEAEYGHLLYFTSNLVNCFIEIKDYASALAECEAYENLLSRMERRFPEMPEEYLDRSRFYLDVDRAICYAGTGESAQAAERFGDALGRDYAASEGGRHRLVDYYAAIGDPEPILQIYADFPYAGADTVSRCYRVRIGRLRDAYANAGRMDEAARLADRYDRLSTLLEEKENAEGVRVKAAQYDTQQYRLALGDTLIALKRYRTGIFLLVLLMIAILAVFLFLNHQMGRRKDTQHLQEAESLEKNLRSLQRQVSLVAERELYQERPAEPDQKEKMSFPERVEGQKLYLNKNLNRESAASLLGVTQAEITRSLSAIEPGLSFPDYIKGLRIRHALQLLGENPDIPIAELADRSGFYTTRTLQRSFLAITGKTPSEYARSLKSQTES